MALSPKPWFAPKTHGYGAGPPVAWQGWAVLLGFAGGLVGAGLWLEGALRLMVSLALVVGLLAVARARTAGGWRWRWNGRPQ